MGVPHLDDVTEWLRRCQRGDEQALAAIVEAIGPRIMRLAMQVLRDRHLAEEASADVFVKVWNSAGKWREEAAAGTWIYRVACNCILDHRRRRPPEHGTLPEVADPAPQPLDRVLDQEKQEHSARRLAWAIAQLDADDRLLVHLYYHDQLPLAEISTITGVRRETLKMRLARARARLRTLLHEENDP